MHRHPVIGILIAFVCTATLMLIVSNKWISFPSFLSFDSFSDSGHSPSPKPVIPTSIIRKFDWETPAKKRIQTILNLDESQIKKEISNFGFYSGESKSVFIERRGFKIFERKNIISSQQLTEKILYIVDYKKIYERNIKFFGSYRQTLMDSAQLPDKSDYLLSFLMFVQSIEYRKPPLYYKGKFINSFFLPLICLLEQYGDCDSKSLLLATFLGASPDFQEKLGIVLIRGNGVAHALLAIKIKPLPGMVSLLMGKKGSFVPLETSCAGWLPGFLSKRVVNILQAGYFNFIEIN